MARDLQTSLGNVRKDAIHVGQRSKMFKEALVFVFLILCGSCCCVCSWFCSWSCYHSCLCNQARYATKQVDITEQVFVAAQAR